MEGRNMKSHHLSLPNKETQDIDTIYKLRLSMKKTLSPQTMDTPSPQGSKELRDLLQRLVEIDTESREILMKVFSVLEKDEKLEKYVKKRIDDPKVSRMWELVEQVLSCQHDVFDDVVYCDDKEIKEEKDEQEELLKLGRFRVRNLDSSSGVVKTEEGKM